jgi:hypothetical protein
MRTVALVYLGVTLFCILAGSVGRDSYGIGPAMSAIITAPLGLIVTRSEKLTLAIALANCALIQAGLLYLIELAVRRWRQKPVATAPHRHR